MSGVGVWGLLRTTGHHPEAVSADPPEPTAPTTAPTSTTPPTTAPPVHEPITIAFAGDIYGEALPKEGFVAGMSDRLAPMAPLLSAADLTVANLETAITERGTPYDKQFTLRAPPEILDVIADSGIDVVFLHWGIEKDVCPSGAQKDLAQQLSDAGADIVVGGHAHRVQGGGFLGPTAVHYGLGNFAFYSASEDSAQTGVFTVTVGPDGVSDQTWHPGRIDEFTPVPLAGAEADAALTRWHELRSCAGLSAVPSGVDRPAQAP